MENHGLAYFRRLPDWVSEKPPLLSALQSFETMLLMLALGRYPSALTTCVSAWESLMKAHLKIAENESKDLYDLIEKCAPAIKHHGCPSKKQLHEVRKFRNKKVHYGFSPDDDEISARLLLETGIPFFKSALQGFFDFYLCWEDVEPSCESFDDLPKEQKDKVGMFPDHSKYLDWTLKIYQKRRRLPNVSMKGCFYPLNHWVRLGLKDWIQPIAEDRVQIIADEGGMLFEQQQILKEQIKEEWNHMEIELNCPFCNEATCLMVLFNETQLDQNRLHPQKTFCVHCNFAADEREPYLLEVVLKDEIKNSLNEISRTIGAESLEIL